MRFPLIPLAILCAGLPLAARAQVRIAEFMASNTQTLTDEDGDSSDWIEIQNYSATNVNLLNWALTDSASTPAKWLFPNTNLGAGAFMVVFADGKNRRAAGFPLHTSFSLAAEGEYLALTRPDGTAATAFSPRYPQQFPDVSYGIEMRVATFALVESNSAVSFLVPSGASTDSSWMLAGFSDAGWSSGVNGLGYETGIADPQENSFALKVLDTQPEAYWRFNETNGPSAANSSSEGVVYDAGYIGAFTFSNAGPRPPQFGFFESNNLAAHFDGGSYVHGPHQLLDSLAAFSMGGWIKPMATLGDRTGLFGQNDCVEFGFISADQLNVWTPSGGSVSYTWPYPTNEWHHVMAVGGNGALGLYVDGTNVASAMASSGVFGTSDYDFNIGGGGVWDVSGNFFTGLMDEVAVWRRALTTNEIASLLAGDVEQTSLAPYISTPVQSQMYGSNASVYVRIPFTVTNLAAISGLKLQVRFDDGFAAYLNGRLIASFNAPESLAWNSAATRRHPNRDAVNWVEFDAGDALSSLQSGSNVLAIQGLNISPDNTDFLIQARLVAETVGNTGAAWRYYVQPTPGGPNGTSASDWGPVITAAGHAPAALIASNSLTVTTVVAQALAPVANVTLHYRSMFGSEATVAMNDSGVYGDGVAGDGIWAGIIPAGIVAEGQLLRYYVTASDTDGSESRWPIYPNSEAQQYFGTVAVDPSIHSLLPVVHLFIEDIDAANTTTGSSASIFYLGELYDNASISLHGQSSSGWPKKSYNLDLPKDHELLYKTGAPREKKIRLLSNYGDKMRMHTTLTYKIVELAGAYGHFSFPTRVQLNGSFFGIEDMVESGDEYFLSRLGLDPNGALYKAYDALDNAWSSEKKTRKSEGADDLAQFIASLDESRSLSDRTAYGYDHIDLPQAANYFATMAICSSQDLGHKNYYVYHDNDGTGEWSIMPWDVDLTWGRNWVDSIGYFSDILYQDNTLSFYNPSMQSKSANRFFDLFFDSPDFRQMYLRRLRTLMDTILMPPTAANNQLVIEPIIRAAEDLMQPAGIENSDAILDYNKWGPDWSDTNNSILRVEAERTISIHLAGRRDFLFTSNTATLNGEPIPPGQPSDARLVFGDWDFKPASGDATQQYVELKNTNAYAVDISGWKVAGAVGYTFRGGTVVPAGKSIYLAPSVPAFRARTNSPTSGENRYVQGPYAGLLSVAGNSALFLYNNSNTAVSSNSYAVYTTAQFAADHLAVLRVGNGTDSLANKGNPVSIDQYSLDGTRLNSVPAPFNGSNAFLISGSASSEGGLTRSADGRLLVMAGYHVALTNSSSSLSGASASAVPRAVGVFDIAGSFAITGSATNQYSKNNIRSAASDGCGNYWGAGANSGTYYFGDSAPFAAQTNVANTRVIQYCGSNLFFSTSSGTPGLWKITNAPASTNNAAALVFTTGTNGSPFGFVFNSNFTTAYVADDTLAGTGGVQRWDGSNNTWTLSYVFNGLTNAGARGLAVDFSGTRPVLYGTTAESTANRLVAWTDAGAASAITTLATAGANQLFRGVAFTPDSGAAPRLFQSSASASGFRFGCSTLIGSACQIQYSDSLTAPHWITLTNFNASGPEVWATDITPAAAARFYLAVLTQ